VNKYIEIKLMDKSAMPRPLLAILAIADLALAIICFVYKARFGGATIVGSFLAIFAVVKMVCWFAYKRSEKSAFYCQLVGSAALSFTLLIIGIVLAWEKSLGYTGYILILLGLPYVIFLALEIIGKRYFQGYSN
jgi:hypothetical protein